MTAPQWLTDLLSEHHAIKDDGTQEVLCWCLWSPAERLYGMAAWDAVYAHVAQTVWDALNAGHYLARNGQTVWTA